MQRLQACGIESPSLFADTYPGVVDAGIGFVQGLLAGSVRPDLFADSNPSAVLARISLTQSLFAGGICRHLFADTKPSVVSPGGFDIERLFT